MTTATRVSRMAVASFVLGLACLVCGIVSRSRDYGLLAVVSVGLVLPGLLLSVWARCKVKNSGGALRGSVLATWGSVLSIVAVPLLFLQAGV